MEAKLNEFYSLRFHGFDGHVAVFEVLDIYEKNFEKVLRELGNLGYWAALKKRDGRVVLFVFPAGKIPPRQPPLAALALPRAYNTLDVLRWLLLGAQLHCHP
ncbi:hypothetical protein [Thermococcus peptonophilus]|uniref:hypothetical protein n=1 Tax=Thermococcus peptonophilus TaxID=53952 RepID=UPI00373FDC97